MGKGKSEYEWEMRDVETYRNRGAIRWSRTASDDVDDIRLHAIDACCAGCDCNHVSHISDERKAEELGNAARDLCHESKCDSGSFVKVVKVFVLHKRSDGPTLTRRVAQRDVIPPTCNLAL